MIPQQLDLFGMSPKPPKKILSDEFSDAKQKAVPPISSPVNVEPPSDNLPDEPHLDEPAIDVIEESPVLEIDAHEEGPTTEIADAEITIEDTAEAELITVPDDEAQEEPLELEELVDEEKDAPNTSEVPENASNLTEDATPIVLNQENSAVIVKNTPVHFGEEMMALNIPPDEELYKRQYYSMRETAAMFDLPQPLLRHWEIEFDIVAPKKNKKGDRHFRPVDIKNLQLIYHLLKVKKFTLDGARAYLQSRNKALDTFELTQRLEKLKLFLYELKAHL